MTYHGMSMGWNPRFHDSKVGVQKFILTDYALFIQRTASTVLAGRWRTSMLSTMKEM